MLDSLTPDMLLGIAYGGAGGFVAGAVVTACLFFHFEARALARKQQEEDRQAKARRAAQAALNWPGAANDDAHPRTARSELRSGPR